MVFIYTNNNQLEKTPFIIAAKKVIYLKKEPNKKCENKIYVRKTLKFVKTHRSLQHTHTKMHLNV